MPYGIKYILGNALLLNLQNTQTTNYSSSWKNYNDNDNDNEW